ncbi:MAG: response regulator [Candidatus Limiplasma sp.]|nr:response regulator [Candidatus Limiplasma sp.]
MYKVFLVDDEIVVREGIRSNFPWEQTDFMLAGEAPDGEMALSMLQDIKPDILITDIRMPFMDGLELCRAVSATMPWMYIVILSGYDDFAYAREAISLGVKEYLLKPVSGQELLQVLNHLADSIREDKRQKANLRTVRDQLASSGQILKQRLLTDLISGTPETEVMERARALQMSLTAGRYLVMVVDLGQEAVSAEETRAAEIVLCRLAESSNGAVCLSQVQGRFLMLVMGDDDGDIEERTYGLAQAVRFEVERNTEFKPLMAIGTTVHALGDVPLSYADATALLRTLHKADKAHSERRIVGVLDIAPKESLTLANVKVPQIFEQLRNADSADVDTILSEYLRSIGQSAAQSKLMINYIFVDIVLSASRIIRDCGGDPQEIIPTAFQAENKSATAATLEEAMDMARELLHCALAFRDEQGSTRYGVVIRKAKAFIDDRYADPNLTLREVAGHVALSNNHFCTVFSQETGVTFTEYLTGVRMAKARSLLRDKQMRTSDVAFAVGYNDPHYFSYLFKKYTGLSPRDYRKGDEMKL